MDTLAWSPDGREIWFSGVAPGEAEASIHAITLAGKERSILRIPGALSLYDISREGKVLLTRTDDRVSMEFVGPDDEAARDYGTHTYFARRGYVSARVDIRGFGASEGTPPDREYSAQEQQDAEQVIAWLAR